MWVPILIGGGVVLAGLFGLRVHAVSKQKAAAAAKPVPSPAAVQAAAAVQSPARATVTSPAVSAQVAAVAQKAGLSVAQFNQIAADAGTTPQAVVNSAVSSGDDVADELIRQAQQDNQS